MKRRIFSMAVALLMMFSFLNVPVLAEVTEAGVPGFTIGYPGPTEDLSGYTTPLDSLFQGAEGKSIIVTQKASLAGQIQDSVKLEKMAEIMAMKQLLSGYLYTAKTYYEGKGFSRKLPENIPVHIYIPANLDKDEGNYSRNGSMYFSTGNGILDELKHDAAHELFHTLQLQYFNDYSNYTGAYSMYFRRWFIEATADFAANCAFSGKDRYMGEGIKMNFLNSPLTYSPSNSDRHQYHAAYFLDYIVNKQHKLTLAQLWDEVAGTWNAGGSGISGVFDTLTPMNSALGIHGKTTLNEMYYQFAENLVFGNDSPVWNYPKVRTRASVSFSEKDPISAGLSEKVKVNWEEKAEITTSLTTKGEGTGKLCGVQSDFDTKKKKEISILAELGSELPENTSLGIVVLDLKGNARMIGSLTNTASSRILTVKPYENVYLLFTNVSDGEKTIKVKLSKKEVELKVTPEKQNGAIGKPISITANVEKATDEMKQVECIVDFGDKLKGTTKTMTIHSGSGSISVNHSYKQSGTFTGSVKFVAKQGKTSLILGIKNFSVTIPADSQSGTKPGPKGGSKDNKTQYAWVLTGTQEYNKLADGETLYRISGGSGSYTLGYKIFCGDRNADESFAVTYSWTEPPKVIYPQDTVEMKITGSLTDNSMVFYSFSTSMAAFFDRPDIDPGFYGGGPVLVDKTGDGQISFSKADAAGATKTKMISVKPGTAYQNSGKMALIVALYNGRSAGTKYIYEWQKIK